MNTVAADWRKDLEAARDLDDVERRNFGFVLAWYDGWRMRVGLEV